MTDDDRWLTCLHEAGHCTVAFLLGATSGAGPVTAEPLGEHMSGCAFTGSPPPGPRAAEIRAQVYLAGPSAEELFSGGEIPCPAAVDTEPAAAARMGQRAPLSAVPHTGQPAGPGRGPAA